MRRGIGRLQPLDQKPTAEGARARAGERWQAGQGRRAHVRETISRDLGRAIKIGRGDQIGEGELWRNRPNYSNLSA
jgi:hypothetical protein